MTVLCEHDSYLKFEKKRSDNLGYGPVHYEWLIFLLFLPALMDYL